MFRASEIRCGHSSMKGTLNRDESESFDEGSDATVLAPYTGLPARGATESVRGVRSSTVHAVENAAAREHRPERCSALRSKDEET